MIFLKGVALVTSMICRSLLENQSIYIEQGEIRLKSKRFQNDSSNKDGTISKDVLKVITSQFDKLSLNTKIILKVCAVAGRYYTHIKCVLQYFFYV